MGVNLENPTVVRILKSAASCFGRGGYHGTSLREIAKSASVSKALIHYHFDNKDSLLFELQNWLHEQLAEEVRQIALSRQPGLNTTFHALDQLAESMIRLAPLNRVFMELGAITVGRDDLLGAAENFHATAVSMIETGLVQTLGDAIRRLVIPPRRMAKLILACLHGIALMSAYGGASEMPDRFEDLKAVMRHGILREHRAEVDVADGIEVSKADTLAGATSVWTDSIRSDT